MSFSQPSLNSTLVNGTNSSELFSEGLDFDTDVESTSRDLGTLRIQC